MTEEPTALEQIQAAEADLGLEYVGREHGSNRATRRSFVKILRKGTKAPSGWQTMYFRGDPSEPMTPTGLKRLASRRAATKVAKAARRRNRGNRVGGPVAAKKTAARSAATRIARAARARNRAA